jgi:prevent-host-death family protein
MQRSHKGQVKKGGVKTGQITYRTIKSQKTGSQKTHKKLHQTSSGRYASVATSNVERSIGKKLAAQVSKTLRNIAALSPDTVTAAQLRNRAGEVLERVMTQGSVTITRHRRPSAVMLSIDVYESLLQSAQSPLNTLTTEFDALVEQMQTGKAKQAARALFTATPTEFGKAAAAAAKSRG